jgi:hypothetical protein
MVWAAGTPWIDPGATATDASVGNLSASITVAGSVNISVSGTNTLTYSVTDASGNTSSTTRTRRERVAGRRKGMAATEEDLTPRRKAAEFLTTEYTEHTV